MPLSAPTPKVSPVQRWLFFFFVYGSLAALSLWLSYEIRFSGGVILTTVDKDVEGFLFTQRPHALLWIVPLKFLLLGLFGQFRGVFYYFRLHDALRMVFALSLATLVILLLPFVSGMNGPTTTFGLPRSVALVDFNLSLLLFVGFRVSIRTLRERLTGSDKVAQTSLERIAIVGAGNSGEQLASDLLSHRGHGLQPVCFLDDNAAKHGLEIHGIPVVGAPEKIPSLVEKYGVTEVILALPAQSAKRIREISAIASTSGLRVLVVPSMAELAGGRVRATDLRPVSVEDLLGRSPAQLDDTAIGAMINGCTVLVTGAGGSIGQEICRQVALRQPGRLIMLDQCEALLYQAEQDLIAAGGGALICPVVADVTDEPRMREVFARHRPTLVLHAAAHKHVPMMEPQPGEALKNNSLGTALVAALASEFQVGRFVLISTDKAINPTNVMGASKRLAEMVVQSMQGRPGNITQFVAVRFGNVLGSSGSVIPIFRKQIAAGGPVTVTHPDVKRYFMTIPEAVGLVLQSATQGEGGDILVLEMGQPMKIVDVARQLIELSGFRPDIDIEIKFVGLRPGEKLVEELQHHGEQYRTTKHERIFRFIASGTQYDALAGLLSDIRALIPQEKSACKQGLKRLVPEYVPYLD
ncbi:MAG: nucleoside-diphosphate sugar epimerase/dehydratase [Verrucomicrobia bacterium]|nr:nucleoside-diphosphate sugar epimerase/dehydratase [Verrucomicrobiota bacterium]